MSKTRPPYPAEFRQQIFELAATGKIPKELSDEFGVSAQTVVNWVGASKAGVTFGATGKQSSRSAEQEEVARLRRELKTSSDGARHFGKGCSLIRGKQRQDIHSVYEVVNTNQAKFPVRTMCRALDVSTSGFYDWSSRAHSARSIANAVRAERVEQIHKESHHT